MRPSWATCRTVRIPADPITQLLALLPILIPLQVIVCRLSFLDALQQGVILLGDPLELLSALEFVQAARRALWRSIVDTSPLHDACHALDQGPVVALNLAASLLLDLSLLELLVEVGIHLWGRVVDAGPHACKLLAMCVVVASVHAVGANLRGYGLYTRHDLTRSSRGISEITAKLKRTVETPFL